LYGWSAPEVPPAPGSYACLATLERVTGSPLELRLRVDPARSDLNGWVGVLEAAEKPGVQAFRRSGVRKTSPERLIRMPVALAPGQALFWAVSRDRDGRLALHAAPAGYRLQSAAPPGGNPAFSDPKVGATGEVRAITLGSDAAGGHPLNGLVAGARLLPGALSPESLTAVQQQGVSRE
jgi:hypothetical protein